MKLLKVLNNYSYAVLFDDVKALSVFEGEEEVKKAINGYKEKIIVLFYEYMGHVSEDGNYIIESKNDVPFCEIIDSLKSLLYRFSRDCSRYEAPLTKEDCVLREFQTLGVLGQLNLLIIDANCSKYTFKEERTLIKLLKDPNRNIALELCDFLFRCEHPEKYDIWYYSNGEEKAFQLIEDYLKVETKNFQLK